VFFFLSQTLPARSASLDPRAVEPTWSFPSLEGTEMTDPRFTSFLSLVDDQEIPSMIFVRGSVAKGFHFIGLDK